MNLIENISLIFHELTIKFYFEKEKLIVDYKHDTYNLFNKPQH